MRSIVDINQTETLVDEGFAIVFREIHRYLQLMEDFQGIDWSTYVHKRNKTRKEGKVVEPVKHAKLRDEADAGNLSEEEKERANEELERMANYEDEEGVEEEDPEEKARQESRTKEEQRIKAEMHKLKALYDETYLKRLLRLLDVLTSISVIH